MSKSTTALATISALPSTSSVSGIERWMATVTSLLASMTPTELAATADKAGTAHRLLAALKASELAKAKANEIQLIALRALAKLNKLDLIKGVVSASYRAMAERLGKLPEDDFVRLLKLVTGARTALSVFQDFENQLRSESWDEDERNLLHRILSGKVPGQFTLPGRGVIDPDHIRQAATTLLDYLSNETESFTMASAVEHLAETLDIDLQIKEQSIVRDGLYQAVRLAIMKEEREYREIEIDGDPESIHIPQFVTYYDDDASQFVRVPWRAAGIKQLRFMVEYREHQLADMLAVTTNLRRLLDYLEIVTRRSTAKPTQCEKLVSLALKSRWAKAK